MYSSDFAYYPIMCWVTEANVATDNFFLEIIPTVDSKLWTSLKNQGTEKKYSKTCAQK